LGSTGPRRSTWSAWDDPTRGIEFRRVEHTPAAVDALVTHIATLEPDPAEVRVVIETHHGLRSNDSWTPATSWSRSTTT
jgi:hypothetical protein